MYATGGQVSGAVSLVGQNICPGGSVYFRILQKDVTGNLSILKAKSSLPKIFIIVESSKNTFLYYGVIQIIRDTIRGGDNVSCRTYFSFFKHYFKAT
jgi:hypothetical protein